MWKTDSPPAAAGGDQAVRLSLTALSESRRGWWRAPPSVVSRKFVGEVTPRKRGSASPGLLGKTSVLDVSECWCVQELPCRAGLYVESAWLMRLPSRDQTQ